MQCRVCSEQCRVCSEQCRVCNVQCIVCSVMCAVHSFDYTLHSVRHKPSGTFWQQTASEGAHGSTSATRIIVQH